MPKILTDKELAEIVSRAVNDQSIIDDGDSYQHFVEELAELVSNHFGGTVGSVEPMVDDGGTVGSVEPMVDDGGTVGSVAPMVDDGGTMSAAFHVNECVPDNGGIFADYDTDVVWKDGKGPLFTEGFRTRSGDCRQTKNGESIMSQSEIRIYRAFDVPLRGRVLHKRRILDGGWAGQEDYVVEILVSQGSYSRGEQLCLPADDIFDTAKAKSNGMGYVFTGKNWQNEPIVVTDYISKVLPDGSVVFTPQVVEQHHVSTPQPVPTQWLPSGSDMERYEE